MFEIYLVLDLPKPCKIPFPTNPIAFPTTFVKKFTKRLPIYFTAISNCGAIASLISTNKVTCFWNHSKFTRYYKNENREKELENLNWFQKQVTLLVEIRDAIAPQLEIAVKYIGNLFVNFLTKVVGKAIGLVGKGILQGLGRSSTK